MHAARSQNPLERSMRSPEQQAALVRDIEYQQERVLLLVNEVSNVPGTGRKLDGLTKLAKLDFLCRYPDAAQKVAVALGKGGSYQSPSAARRSGRPMIRYKYGPWDDRYYAILGALVGRGLITYAKGRRGSVAMRMTSSGRELAKTLEDSAQWADVIATYRRAAHIFGTETGNQLKEAVYAALPDQLDVAHRTEIP